ncbi:diacylglycerol O-acyltransferase [Martiniozyma asiatica (nom. inval.)]|nr:diacylglycerol O-acyltransferase [Martiniozyma asiatica]
MARFPEYRPLGRTHTNFFVSWKRRRQTLAVLLVASTILILPALYFYLWTKPTLWPILLLYSFYSFFLDDTLRTGESVHRESSWLKKQQIYKDFCDYFPIRIHRTVPLPRSLVTIKKTIKCFPVWTWGLSKSARSILKNLKLISEKERLVTVESPVGPRYIFAYHPHGVIAFGITGISCFQSDNPTNDPHWFTDPNNVEKSEFDYSHVDDDNDDNDKIGISKNFGPGILTSSKSFSNLFPGIKSHLLTLTTQFLLPFYRDYIYALGVGLVTKRAISSTLALGHSVTIVVGGAHESLLAKPGKNSIVLNKRKGFIKLALKNAGMEESISASSKNIKNGEWEKAMGDIAIIPVYGFGENNIHKVYYTSENKNLVQNFNENTHLLSFFLKIQLILKKFLGFTIPLVNSRGIFNYDFGLLPYRRGIDVVYGEPIYITRRFGNKPGDEVTIEEVEYYHKIYLEKLKELWNKNKKFCFEQEEPLKIVE